MIQGIDVSAINGDIDFQEVAKTKQFVITKATEGVAYVASTFGAHRDTLRMFNIPHGFYHFARPDLNSPEAEANYFADNVADLQAGELLILDYEDKLDDQVEWCKRFLDHLSSRFDGYKPLLYTNLERIQNGDWSSVINDNYGLWVAVWDENTDTLPQTPWPVVAMKQYSDQGHVPGIQSHVDLDVFNGDVETFKKYGYAPKVGHGYVRVESASPAPIPMTITTNNKDPVILPINQPKVEPVQTVVITPPTVLPLPASTATTLAQQVVAGITPFAGFLSDLATRATSRKFLVATAVIAIVVLNQTQKW